MAVMEECQVIRLVRAVIVEAESIQRVCPPDAWASNEKRADPLQMKLPTTFPVLYEGCFDTGACKFGQFLSNMGYLGIPFLH